MSDTPRDSAALTAQELAQRMAEAQATLPTEMLRRLLWAAKGCRCSCLWSGGSNVPSKRDYECPRCKVIRDVQEAVPHVI